MDRHTWSLGIFWSLALTFWTRLLRRFFSFSSIGRLFSSAIRVSSSVPNANNEIRKIANRVTNRGTASISRASLSSFWSLTIYDWPFPDGMLAQAGTNTRSSTYLFFFQVTPPWAKSVIQSFKLLLLFILFPNRIPCQRYCSLKLPLSTVINYRQHLLDSWWLNEAVLTWLFSIPNCPLDIARGVLNESLAIRRTIKGKCNESGDVAAGTSRVPWRE